jgi:hypothetical protein
MADGYALVTTAGQLNLAGSSLHDSSVSRAVGEIFLLKVTAHAVEREHGDGGPIPRLKSLFFGGLGRAWARCVNKTVDFQ